MKCGNVWKAILIPTDTTHGTCYGRGVCASISDWAAAATDEFEDARSVTYDASGGAASWDYDHLYSCRCHTDLAVGANSDQQDATGYGCEMWKCLEGHFNTQEYINPSSFETQEITCDATGGSFTLSFRGQTTGAIAYNAVAMRSSESGSSTGTGVGESLQAKLESLSTVTDFCATGKCGGVSITYTSGSNACTNGGANVISVEFIADFGDLPPLSASASSLTGGAGTVTIIESVRGTKFENECSGKGECDRTTGLCRCYKGFGNSDGQGNFGPRDDCGNMDLQMTNFNFADYLVHTGSDVPPE